MATGTLTDRLRETLALFEREGEPQTTTEVANSLDVGRRSTYERLEKLVEHDRLETKKVGANARVWWRPPTTPGRKTPDRSAVDDSLGAGVLDTVAVGIFVLDEDFDVARINDATERYFGLDRDAVLGRDKRALVDERIAPAIEDPDAFAETVLATYDDNTDTERFECYVTAGDEREARWLEHRSKPIETGAYAGGRVELYYDITDRKRSQRARRDERQEFESLVKAVEEYAIFTLDADGYVQTWNPGAEQIKGYAADDIVGEHFSTFYTEEDRAAGVPEANLAAAAADGSTEDEGWRVRRDGSRFWASVTITAIRDDDGDLQGYAKVTRDMTDRRRAEAERDLLYETTRSIAEADTFEAGLRAALRDVCEVTDWEYAEAWLPTDDGGLRRGEADYHADCLAEFAAFSREFTFGPGEGLPGRVYESGEFEWAADLPSGSPGEYPRLDEALDAGLRSALGVPVVARGEVVAVLTFLVRESQERDERFVSLVTSIAQELGDLIARRWTEEQLEQEQELIERIFETAPIGLAVFSPDREIERANEWMVDILDPATEDPTAYTAGDLTLLDEDGQSLAFEERPVGHVFETGDPVFDRELQVPTSDGSTRWVSVNATPWTDETGAVTRVVATTTEITRLKAQAKRLKRRRDEARAELDEVYRRIDEAFFALDEDWRFTHVNDRAAEMVQLPARELIGAVAWDVLPEIADGSPRSAAERAMETQESFETEFYSELLEIWVEIRGYPSETGLSVYVRDITERKEHEQELELYEAIVSTIQDGVYVLDEDLCFTQVNDAYVEMTGYEREDLLGTHCSLVVDDDLVPESADQPGAMIPDGADSGLLEADLHRADGSRLPTESRFAALTTGSENHYEVGVVRDISERKERERELRDRIRQQEVVTDLGQRALEGRNLDALMADAAELVADTLDNEYCKVLDLDDEGEGLLLRQGVGWYDGIVGEATVSATEDDSQAAHTLATEGPVVVEDLVTESRFSGPDLLRGHDVRSGISTIIGPPHDPWGILGTHDTDSKEFSENDATFVQAVANVLASAIDRHEYEQKLIQQREQVAALNSLNEVAREITAAVIDQSTREEIEETVCERLAATDSYLFAWTGEVDPTSQTVALRAEAGVEGYLDGITISVDPDDARSEGPTGRALKTGETQVTNDIRADSRHDPWREHIEQYGVRSSAAIPIAHQDTIYGVLNVYADRPYAFEGQERAVISQLGEVVGQAIAAAERKQALLSDELVELDFKVRDVFAAVDAPVETSGTITHDKVVMVEDGEFLVYGTATEDAVDTVHRLVEVLPHWESVRVISEDEPARFELRVVDPPVLSVVASHGGCIDEAVIEDGDYRTTIHLPPTTDVRQVTTAVEEAYPNAELLRRRQITRTGDQRPLHRQLLADLTDRQRASLEAAYHAGFFEWPRDTSGEEVADSLDVASPTFHQHLRKAERKVFDAIFSPPAQNAA